MTPTDAALDPLTPVPLTVLTGFLGSGKTSRLNRWLADPAFSDTLVIVNEFGEVGLDHLLIEAAPDDVVLMAAGCMCCSLRGDLVMTLEDLLRRRDNRRIRFFRQVIIETTGLADPLPILHAVLQHPYLSRRFSIRAVLTTVDAVHGAQTLDAHPEARRQVALADALILTKTDIASPADQAAAIAGMVAINPFATHLDPADADDPQVLLQPRFDPMHLDGRALATWLGVTAEGDGPAAQAAGLHHRDIETFAFIAAEPVSEAQLIVFTTAMRMLHGPKLLRMKGLISMAGDPDHPVVLHQVQSVAHPPVRLARWPGRDRRSRLVFIVAGIPRATIEGFWQALMTA